LAAVGKDDNDKYNVAEQSRQHQQFKEKMKDERSKEKTNPWPRKEYNEAKYVNWMAKHLWPKIRDAGRKAGPAMSASRIVTILHKEDPLNFSRLS
jgi:hypothetical protein